MTIATTLDEALAFIAEDPTTLILSGGTDLMVEVNFGVRRPTRVVKLHRIPELSGWRIDGDQIVLGAGMTYTEMETAEFAEELPALSQAARTVGSPQIRNAGTIGGNLGTGSPAGDTLPVLAALDASIVLASHAGKRELPIDEFLVGPKRTGRRDDELITEVRIPITRGAQEFLKVGVRNAMVIAVCSVALIVDHITRTVRVGMGAVGPTALRAPEAERWVSDRVDWESGHLDDAATSTEFGAQVAAAARPIDDHRSTAEYRRRAIGILAERALRRAL